MKGGAGRVNFDVALRTISVGGVYYNLVWAG
jgi:hypothetical protein